MPVQVYAVVVDSESVSEENPIPLLWHPRDRDPVQVVENSGEINIYAFTIDCVIAPFEVLYRESPRKHSSVQMSEYIPAITIAAPTQKCPREFSPNLRT
jgi:hypothetical protein